jgi:pilus assembly protein Flp/PilA
MLTEMAKRFRHDEDGAAMVEYSVLIGIITVGAIIAITAVGVWVTGSWEGLQTAIGA